MPSENSDKRINIALMILLTLMISAAIAAGLYIRAQTAEQNDMNVVLAEKLEELEDENIRLRIEIATAFYLEELEDRARNELGMSEPGSQNTVAIDTEVKDRAVILNDAENGITGDWTGRIRNIFDFGQ